MTTPVPWARTLRLGRRLQRDELRSRLGEKLERVLLAKHVDARVGEVLCALGGRGAGQRGRAAGLSNLDSADDQGEHRGGGDAVRPVGIRRRAPTGSREGALGSREAGARGAGSCFCAMARAMPSQTRGGGLTGLRSAARVATVSWARASAASQSGCGPSAVRCCSSAALPRARGFRGRRVDLVEELLMRHDRPGSFRGRGPRASAAAPGGLRTDLGVRMRPGAPGRGLTEDREDLRGPGRTRAPPRRDSPQPQFLTAVRGLRGT